MYSDKKNLEEPVYSLCFLSFESVEKSVIINTNKLKEKTNICKYFYSYPETTSSICCFC